MDPRPPQPREHPALIAYLEHLAAGRFFEAHEALEAAWRPGGTDPLAADPIARALIQLAAAYVLRQRGRPEGAQRLMGRVRRALTQAQDGWWGLDLTALREHVVRLGSDPAAWPEDALSLFDRRH